MENDTIYMETDSIWIQLLEVIYFNKFISENDYRNYRDRYSNPNDQDKFIMGVLVELLGENFEKIVNSCIENKLFTLDEYAKACRGTMVYWNIPKTESRLSKVKEENKPRKEKKEGNGKKEEGKKEAQKAVKKKSDRTEMFTEKEINTLIEDGENLYRSVPWNLVPKDNNIFYSRIQLFRFIDSWASDFSLETQKKDGKIYFKIIFKIDGEQEVQDSSEPRYPTDETKNNQNLFFSKVRKYIGSWLARINADQKHVMQDWSFSLEYKDNIRDFRLNSMPCRCYWKPYPRYTIRLASEWDNIDFDSIRMLAFTKKYYNEMIYNKIAWVIAITWPTWSWKTTTIYWMLNKIDKEKFSVLSIEKPIESQVHWLNQTEEDLVQRHDSNEKYTNKEWMKWVLRQALDVIFIWEMRDAEETKEGIKAWLVWNKLITTFHTNSCVDTILRLKEEWLSNNAIWNWVKYITAQRLVPVLCTHCRIPIEGKEKDEIISKIKKSFLRPQRNLQVKLWNILEKKDISEFSVEDLEFYLEKNVNFIWNDDKEKMIKILLDNEDKLNAIKDNNKKIELILELIDWFPNPEVNKEFKMIKEDNLCEANTDGCEHCRWGYKWRVGIFEVLKIDKIIKRFIQDPSTKLIELEEFLIEKWFISMREYWYFYVMEGEIAYHDLLSITE